MRRNLLAVTWNIETVNLGLKPRLAPAEIDGDAKVGMVRGDAKLFNSRKIGSSSNRRSLNVRAIAIVLTLTIAALQIPSLRAAQIVAPTGKPLLLDVSKGLIIRLDRPCSSVFVADPDIADVQLKSPTVLYIMGKGAGETTVYAVDKQDVVLLDSRVEVHQDIDQLEQDIQQIDPTGTVRVRAVHDSIVLEGTVKDAAEGDDIRKIAVGYVAKPAQLVNKLTLAAPNQVDLQVRVAEVQRSVLKQFGINWENVQQSSVASFGFVSATPALTTTSGSAATLGVAGTSLASGSTLASTTGFNTGDSSILGSATNNNLFASFRSGDLLISAVVDMLAQQGLLTILAEPDLVTVSGQKASFLAGGEFPVPVPQTGGSGTSASITIDWKQFGVSLAFTPTILADGRIALHVAPEVSELASNEGITIQGVTVPGITTRRADTTVELGSGQTFAIAGLLQNTTQQQLNSYPWIGDVPVIGALFRSTAFQRGETELVILVTPYLVQPVSSATALKTANEGFRAPTDRQRVTNGALNATPEPAQPVPAAPSPTVPAPATSEKSSSSIDDKTAGAPAAFLCPNCKAPAAVPRVSPTAFGFEID